MAEPCVHIKLAIKELDALRIKVMSWEEVWLKCDNCKSESNFIETNPPKPEYVPLR